MELVSFPASIVLGMRLMMVQSVSLGCCVSVSSGVFFLNLGLHWGLVVVGVLIVADILVVCAPFDHTYNNEAYVTLSGIRLVSSPM